MKKEVSQKILQVQEIAMEDEDYRLLIDEHALRNARPYVSRFGFTRTNAHLSHQYE